MGKIGPRRGKGEGFVTTANIPDLLNHITHEILLKLVLLLEMGQKIMYKRLFTYC